MNLRYSCLDIIDTRSNESRFFFSPPQILAPNVPLSFVGGSRGSTPEQDREGRLGTSPHINRFLAREPPDGCEKVNLKFVEEAR